jgi:hypothetical protein
MCSGILELFRSDKSYLCIRGFFTHSPRGFELDIGTYGGAEFLLEILIASCFVDR